MFRPQSRHPSDDDLEAVLPQVKRAQLENGWSGVFRSEILPMLWEAEADFSDLYHSVIGSPNKPVAELLGILILKEFHDYTDEQALEAVAFNLQWQYGLQLGFSQAYVCQKTLHNFRGRMVKSQKHQRLFHHLTGQIIDRFGLDTSRQRMDSTHVVGAMKQLTRLGLFVKTIEAFLFKLKRMAQTDPKVASVLVQLPLKFHQRYLEREGYFSDTRSSLASRRVDACAQDLWDLVDRFRSDPKLSKLKQYVHLKRLFKEQCEIVPPPEERQTQPVEVRQDQKEAKGEGFAEASDPSVPAEKADACDPSESPTSAGNDSQAFDLTVGLKDPQQVASTSLQSPSDPDATFGHKGKGYQFQLCETCVPDNPFQVITTTRLQGAHESDQNATMPLLETLEQQGNKPDVAFADSNYISGENIVSAETMDVDLQGPLPGSKPAPEALTLSDFTFDLTDQHVLICPAGQGPLRHPDTQNHTGRSAYFDRTLCDLCPLASLCPTNPNQTERRLTWTPEKLATARRQDEQQTTAFKEAYKIRSGIEATISHDKNDHGLGHLRVRGRPAVELASTFKTLALNVKRAVKYALKTMKETAKTHQPAPGEILAPIFSRKPVLRSLLKGLLKSLWTSEPIPPQWTINGAL